MRNRDAIDAFAFADLLRLADAEDLDRLVGAISVDPAPDALLTRLAASEDPEVRGWVPRLAARALGRKAVPLLLRLSESDGDPDVRGLAMAELESLQPQPSASTVSTLLRHLDSSDDSEVIRAGWQLATLRDKRAIPALNDIVAGSGPRYVRMAASVQLLLLTDAAAIPEAIRAHDHDRMPWLAHGATLTGSQDAMEALRWAETQLPDDECRDATAKALAASS